MATECSYECVNQEALFEQGNPDRMVLASRYKLNGTNSKLELKKLQKEYNFQVTLTPQNHTADEKQNRYRKSVFSAKTNIGEMMNIRYGEENEIIVTTEGLK